MMARLIADHGWVHETEPPADISFLILMLIAGAGALICWIVWELIHK